MDTLAILVAAGRGTRLGGSRPKAFLELYGEPLLLRAARAFEAAPCVDAIVAVVPAGEEGAARAALAPLRKLYGVTAGGAERQDSVRAGLAQAPAGFDGIVLVHDAARPFVEPDLVCAVVAAARSEGAALPVVELADTVKRVDGPRVVATVDRGSLRAAQTPQGFRFRLLSRAYEQAAREGALLTDEAMAVERIGEPVATVPGSTRNRKITTPADMAWAEEELRRSAAAPR